MLMLIRHVFWMIEVVAPRPRLEIRWYEYLENALIELLPFPHTEAPPQALP